MTNSKAFMWSQNDHPTSPARRRVVAAMALAIFAGGVPSVVVGQDKGKGGNKGKGKGSGGGGEKDEETLVDGTIRQLSPQGIYVEANDGIKYLVSVTPDSQVTLQGDVDPSFLVPGAYVEFNVDLDRSGNPVDEIKSLTFVDASPQNPTGLFQTTLPDGANENKDGRASFLARGRVSSNRNGVVVLQTGGKNVAVKVAEGVALTCKLEGWGFAATGDSISGKVIDVPQANTGITRVLARKLTIRTSKPLKPSSKRNEPNS